MQTLVLNYKFPSLNDYIFVERGNRHAANKMKRTLTEYVALECKAQKLRPVKTASIRFTWIEKNRRRDKDNIAFSKKFILDGLVEGGVLENDGWEQIQGLSDDFEIGAEYSVIVEIKHGNI